jgi:hypothetical protein
MMVVGAGALVVAVALLISGVAAAVLALVLIAIGMWRAFGLFQVWRRQGSDPNAD